MTSAMVTGRCDGVGGVQMVNSCFVSDIFHSFQTTCLMSLTNDHTLHIHKAPYDGNKVAHVHTGKNTNRKATDEN